MITDEMMVAVQRALEPVSKAYPRLRFVIAMAYPQDDGYDVSTVRCGLTVEDSHLLMREISDSEPTDTFNMPRVS